jgi:hypothetical protein
MRQRTRAQLGTAILLSTFWPALAGDPHQVIVTGEVVDSACYIKSGARDDQAWIEAHVYF